MVGERDALDVLLGEQRRSGNCLSGESRDASGLLNFGRDDNPPPSPLDFKKLRELGCILGLSRFRVSMQRAAV